MSYTGAVREIIKVGDFIFLQGENEISIFHTNQTNYLFTCKLIFFAKEIVQSCVSCTVGFAKLNNTHLAFVTYVNVEGGESVKIFNTLDG